MSDLDQKGLEAASMAAMWGHDLSKEERAERIGEGYGVVVNRASLIAQLGSPEYVSYLEYKMGRDALLRERKMKRALQRSKPGPFDAALSTRSEE